MEGEMQVYSERRRMVWLCIMSTWFEMKLYRIATTIHEKRVFEDERGRRETI